MSGAFHDGLTPVLKSIPNAGGGMSASENRLVNHRGKIIYNAGSPKATDGGKNLGRDATNRISKPGLITEEVSPSACKQSAQSGHRSKY